MVGSKYLYNLGLAFQEVVQTNPYAPALKTSTASLSYQELNQQANQIAHYLLDNDFQSGAVVAIAGFKTPESYSWLLACLKIGVIYTFFDPASPNQRLERILNNCRPQLIVSSKPLEQLTRSLLMHDEAFNQRLEEYSADNLSDTQAVKSSAPAYLMYTSGSTGFPKGAVMTHQNVLNLIQWSLTTYGFNPSERLTHVNPLYFDNSVFDLYSALFSGACLVSFTKEEVGDPALLLNLIDQFNCTSWFSVPTMLIYLQTMRALTSERMQSMKRIIFGGEGYPKPKLKELFDLYGHRTQLFNVYGPTECTCICSSYQITADNFNTMQGFSPLGHLIENFSYLIVDEHNQPLPAGETGELCLLGPQVGLGYYAEPERTAKSFIQNPQQTNYPEIMYKTGDMVCLNPETQLLEIAGRQDNQIKHLGYRIELEEIETALTCLEGVAQAAVIHGLKRGLSQLIAILVLTPDTTLSNIQTGVKGLLPAYMVPTIFQLAEALPTNANGKIDRLKLKEIYLK